jgi:phosphate transport system substrate-binding protein
VGAALVSVFVVVAALVGTPQLAAADGTPVSGGGSSFAELEVDQWRADTSHAPYNLKLDYAAQGSTFGRTQFLNGNLDYGVSDITFQPDDDTSASRFSHFTYVPVSAGGVGFMYNLKDSSGNRITTLHLTATDICRVFTAPNIYWDDPSIQATNPTIALPHNPISRVVRSDGSGTSFVFSDYCQQVAPQVWTDFIAYIQRAGTPADANFSKGLPVSVWPTGYPNEGAANAADGVANAVASDVTGTNAITYNAAGFGQEHGMPNAFIQNAAGVFHQPTPDAASVALAYANPESDGTFQLNYTASDPNAYFPSTYSYVIAQTTGFDPGKGQTLATFLDYAVTIGQKRARQLQYAPLSTVLVNEALDHILLIPGAPPRPTDLGDPPPPASKTLVAPGSGGGATAGGAGSGAKGGKGATTGGATGKSSSGTGAGGSTPGATLPGGVPVTDATGQPVADDGTAATSGPTTTLAMKETANETPASKPVSNKDVVWYFLLGFGVMAVGSVLGVGSSVARSARRPGGAS